MYRDLIERFVFSLEADERDCVIFLDTRIPVDTAADAYEAEFVDATGIDELPIKVGEVVLAAALTYGTHAALVLLDAALEVRRIDGVIDAETIEASEHAPADVFIERYAQAIVRHKARLDLVKVKRAKR